MPFILVSGTVGEEVAVDSLKHGATDYVLKQRLSRLVPAVRRALRETEERAERRRAEQKYQSIFENAVEGMFLSTPDGRFINVNPAMARIYGYDSPQDMVDSIADISRQIYVDPDERGQFIRRLQTHGVVDNLEGRNYRKDGAVIWTSTSARAVRDAVGNTLYYEGFLQDITERKRAEEALKNSEKRFRALIENGLDNISLLAADGALVWESPAVVRTLGYDPDDFLGRDIFELMHPDDLNWVRNLFAELIREPAGRRHSSFQLRHSDGTWRWVEAVATNLLHEPSVEAIVINYRDITERKRAEAAVLESESQMRALVTSLDDIVFEFDEEGTYLNVWTSNESLLALPKAEMLRRRIVEMLGEENGRPLAEAVKRVLASGQAENIEYPLEVVGGQRWFQARTSPILTADGHSRTAVMLVRDITRRKQAEQALREAEQQLRLVVNNAPITIFATDAQGVFTLSEGKSLQTVGLKPGENVGVSAFDLYRSLPVVEDTGAVTTGEAVIRRVLAGETITGITELRGVYFQNQFVPLRDANAQVIGLIGVANDITGRKQAEEALKHRLAELEAVNQVSTALRAAQTLDEMLPRLIDATLSVLGTDAGALWLYDEGRDVVSEAVSRGWLGVLTLSPAQRGEGIAGQVLATGEVYLSREFAADPRTRESVRAQVQPGWGGACVP
ncbi:MAG: PAS domain S-box protein, partial [Chloroflexi bacterium]|nr:PAS domain S-box protein [Chloroflexota bacterium]